MVSVKLLQHCYETSDHAKLVRNLAVNGVPMPLPLQARLTNDAAATALGLVRVVQLTYGPTALSRAMTLHLLDRQLADGSFAGSSHADPLATAAAVAAFSAVLRVHGGQADDRLATAQHRGLAALAAMQAEPTAPGFHSPDDRTEDDRALVAAFVLQLLGDDDDFRQALRFADLVNWFEERADRLDADTAALSQLGRPRHSGAPDPSPALATIAA